MVSKQEKMSTNRGYSLKQEEILCEKIREHPLLYDKSHKGYKEKTAVENAWNDVANQLEFIENGNKSYTIFSPQTFQYFFLKHLNTKFCDLIILTYIIIRFRRDGQTSIWNVQEKVPKEKECMEKI